MINVALTGGIGSGKSLVATGFSLLSIPIYDTDKEAKLLYFDPKIKSQVIELLGSESYIDETLNKNYISQKIFNDKSLLTQLSSILHPAVRTHYSDWLKNQLSSFVIQETALLFETNQQDNFDKIILVTAPEEVRLSRAMLRDNVSIEKIQSRIKNQMPEESKIDFVDYIIVNDGASQIIPQIISIYQDLKRLDSSKDKL